MTRLAIYARVSTHRADQEHGLEAQVRACRRFVSDRGLDVDQVLEYREQASGRKAEDERPQLRRLLQDAAMKRFRIMVVFKLDRLSRSQILVTGDVVELVKKLQAYGVRVYSTSESRWDPDNPDAPLILAALSWAASMESRAIADRVSSGIAAKKAEAAERGERFLWGRGRTSRLVEDPQLPQRVLALRGAAPPWKASWAQVAKALDLHVGTARRYWRYATGAESLCLLAHPEKEGAARENGGAQDASSE